MKNSTKHASKRKVVPRSSKKGRKKNSVLSSGSLAVDLSFHVKLMILAGHFLPDFTPGSKNPSKFHLARAVYSIIHMALMSLQFAAMAAEMVLHLDDMAALTTNAITLLFFLHGPTKVFYFAFRRHRFYKTINSWDSALEDWNENADPTDDNENNLFGKKMAWTSGNYEKSSTFNRDEDSRDKVPLFVSSSNTFKKEAERKMRKLLLSIMFGSAVAALFWSVRPFLGLGHYGRTSKGFMPQDNTSTILATVVTMDDKMAANNSTQQWNLIVDATYPWDMSSNLAYMLTLLYQIYWLVCCLAQINLLDLLFCSWLILAGEQIRHLKDILHPLMELSRCPSKGIISSMSDLSTANFGMDMDGVFYQPQGPFAGNRFQPTAPTIFSVLQRPQFSGRNLNSGLLGRNIPVTGALGTQRNMLPPSYEDEKDEQDAAAGALQAIGMGVFQPNDIEMVIQKANKYWVEKHKHIVRFVECVGDSYGMALLIHMLTSTITLTLLSYEATKISSVDMHAITVVTYLFYTLGQVFLFCVYGNNLIEESTSVMQAAYDSPWYECSEEAKTFIQIVCQQSQRPMSISGAKFFTVSLDLFASVLGAVVTYFMVLIQLK